MKNRRVTREEPNTERDALDVRHDSSPRGEHRYPDAHQTQAEQQARRERDDLKRRLERTR